MHFFGSIKDKSPYTRISMQYRLFTFFLILGMSAFAGCHGEVRQRPAAGFDTPGIKKVLVLPFKNMTRIFGENVSIRSPVSGNVFVTGNVSQGSEILLTDLLTNRVTNIEYYELIPPETAEGVFDLNRQDDLEIRDDRDRATQAGQKLGADVVLVGYVYRFKERVGKKYAVDTPASVAFDISMVSTRNGKLLWDAHFDETQKTLSEDLFLIGTFIKRRGAWVTAEQMASMALDDLVKKMPKPRLQP